MTTSSLSSPLAWLSANASATGATEVSPIGDPVAIASLTKSCLLNLALEDSKSKSVVGTSIFGCWGCPPRPPRPPLPPRKAPVPCGRGWRLCCSRIPSTFCARLLRGSVAGAGPLFWTLSLAMASATAAVASCVAFCCCAAVTAGGCDCGTVLVARGLGIGTAGMIRPPFCPPCALAPCCAGCACGGASADATSGFELTGGGGACLGAAAGVCVFPAGFVPCFFSAGLDAPSASATFGCPPAFSSLPA
jgi:hypothetical protein